MLTMLDGSALMRFCFSTPDAARPDARFVGMDALFEKSASQMQIWQAEVRKIPWNRRRRFLL
jgi:hypothetical protein